MLVAQSYTYSTMSSTSSRSNKWATTTTRTSKAKKELKENTSGIKDERPKLLSSMAGSTSSKPVIIPTKTSTSKRKPIKEHISSFHDSKAIPPSMAALLAITSVHNGSSKLTKRGIKGKLLQKEQLSPDDLRYTLSRSSPKSWSILQSPPEEGGEDDDEEEEVFKDCEIDELSIISASTLAPLSCRSSSSDSAPSLDMESDYESPMTFDPPTPAPRIKLELRKILPARSSIGGTDHPLSPPTEHESNLPTPTQEKKFDLEPLPPSRAPGPTSLKSNLTASIRLLKTAARTTLSTIVPIQYTPNPLLSFSFSKTTPPSRVISGPGPGPLILANIDAIPFHMTTPLPDLPIASTSIQLLPYTYSTISSSELATAPPIFLPATSLPSSSILEGKCHPRPREPRENSNFLRIVVLEMNMRRVGKLNNETRARLWLAARRDGRAESEMVAWRGEQLCSRRDVPARWRGDVV